ncbi:thioesterase family protein [Nocardioides sp. CER19]|uniref:acyl-CoA thioesterase n=1 Tax=Nocardioides sp. CER19 TaxID=3038538 RepID=UPI00244756DB|nr:thioesterase family protein [Nocardioides sp. CER19]MDH2416151.1 thioesterase family protein [Nocardioides sp. CER19]
MRFVECDQQGVVFNGHYLVWADEAASRWWSAVGLPWTGPDENGGDSMVKASRLEWSSSARWGDEVAVTARAEALGRSSLSLTMDITVGERLCCRVVTTYVWVVAGRSAAWPPAMRRKLAGLMG